jgi:hypothetical protein
MAQFLGLGMTRYLTRELPDDAPGNLGRSPGAVSFYTGVG